VEQVKLLVKTLTWRLTATATTLILVYLFTNELKIAGTAAIAEMTVKTVIYYLHESIWERIEIIIFGGK